MTQPDHAHDVLIVGGGLVGSSCAIALAQQGIKVGLLDKRVLKDNEFQNIPLDSRVYTITPSNAEWLKSLSVWERLDPAQISIIDAMEIWSDLDAEARAEPTLEFSAYGTKLTHLAFVLEEQVLQAALWSALEDADVEVITGEGVALEIGEKNARLLLADGAELRAGLIVAADGGNSVVRALADIATRDFPYEQKGVVANFQTELPHGNIARQWFTNNGVMAWLPLSGNQISLVWSTKNAESLLTMESAELAEKVAEAGGGILGSLSTITPAQSFPLVLRTAESMVRPRMALVGDAAHQIHPLAGQGVNLGFRDVITLVETLRRRKTVEDIGHQGVLRRYERARKTDLLEMQALTHGLNLLFESDQPVVRSLRNWGMKALNHQSLLKRQLIRQAI
ncbi:MAG TPA: FAD-dependent oxidoreductase [Methylophilaceae bacterium]|nr:FAD-dependent oxidoreductase [Methylophilaceae bacterium]